MAQFSVKPEFLRGCTTDFSAIRTSLETKQQEAGNVISSLSRMSPYSGLISNRLKPARSRLESSGRSISTLNSTLQNIITLYVMSEQKLKDQNLFTSALQEAGVFNSLEASGAVSGETTTAEEDEKLVDYAWKEDSDVTEKEDGSTVTKEWKVLSAEADADADYYVTENEAGASAKASWDSSAAEGSISREGEYAKGAVSGSLFAVSAAAAAKASIGYKEDGTIYGNVSAEAEASAAVAKAEAEGKFGTDDANVYAKAEGALVGAGAEAKAGVTVNENGSVTMTAKAEAEAYLAKGEVKTGFEFLGIKVEAGMEGMVGVQAEVGGEVSSSGVKFDAGLGPLGGNISIDWSGFELPDFSEIDWTFWD